MADPLVNIVLPKFGIDEELVNNRLGSEIDVAIAVENKELTEPEREAILKEVNSIETFNALAPEQKDYFGKRLFQIWWICRIGDHLQQGDNHVVSLIPQLREVLITEEAKLSDKSAKLLQNGAVILLSFAFETKEEEKKKTEEQLLGVIAEYTNRFADSQNDLLGKIDQLDNFPGKSSLNDYLIKYRGVKISEMTAAKKELEELLWQ